MVILFIDAESIFRVQNYIFFTDIGKKKKKKSTMIFSLFPKPMVLGLFVWLNESIFVPSPPV